MAEGLLYGAPGGIRTPDQVVRSHLLYPAELRVRIFLFNNIIILKYLKTRRNSIKEFIR